MGLDKDKLGMSESRGILCPLFSDIHMSIPIYQKRSVKPPWSAPLPTFYKEIPGFL